MALIGCPGECLTVGHPSLLAADATSTGYEKDAPAQVGYVVNSVRRYMRELNKFKWSNTSTIKTYQIQFSSRASKLKSLIVECNNRA